MEIKELEIVEMELKYCELCGGLWMRLQGSRDSYCAACHQRMAAFAFWREPSTRHSKGEA